MTNSFSKLIAVSINSFIRYIDLDLNSILRAIAFPFVFLLVSAQYLHDVLFTFSFKLPEVTYPKPIVHPALAVSEALQLLTVKNLRRLGTFPKSYRKQEIVEALLITF